MANNMNYECVLDETDEFFEIIKAGKVEKTIVNAYERLKIANPYGSKHIGLNQVR